MHSYSLVFVVLYPSRRLLHMVDRPYRPERKFCSNSSSQLFGMFFRFFDTLSSNSTSSLCECSLSRNSFQQRRSFAVLVAASCTILLPWAWPCFRSTLLVSHTRKHRHISRLNISRNPVHNRGHPGNQPIVELTVQLPGSIVSQSTKQDRVFGAFWHCCSLLLRHNPLKSETFSYSRSCHIDMWHLLKTWGELKTHWMALITHLCTKYLFHVIYLSLLESAARSLFRFSLLSENWHTSWKSTTTHKKQSIRVLALQSAHVFGRNT